MNPRVRSVVRTAVMAVNTPLAKGRTRRTLAKADRPLKLEIGGLAQRPGWLVTNVNAVTRHYLDATSRWPLEDASVSIVYADNVIEHLTLDAGRALLAEAHRCLQPGGVIRLVTPDIGKHVALYQSGMAAVEADIGDFYRARGLVVEHPVDLVRIPFACFGHHTGYVYDYAALELELKNAGFHSVTERPLGESDHPDLRGLDGRTAENAAQMAVEAIR